MPGAGAPVRERSVVYRGVGCMLTDIEQQRLTWMVPTREGVTFCALPEGLVESELASAGAAS